MGILYKTLPKGGLTHNDGPVIVLQGAAYNLRGRGRSAANQHREGYLRIKRGIQGFEVPVPVTDFSFGADDQFVFRNENVADIHCFVEQATRISPQVKDEALQLVVCFQGFIGLAYIFSGIACKLGKLDVADGVIDHSVEGYIFNFYFFALYFDELILQKTFAPDKQLNASTRIAFKEFTGIFHFHLACRLTIDFNNQVTGLQPGFESR